MAWIYEIRNNVKDAVYIGSTKNLDKKYTEHRTALRNNSHYNIHLQRAWNKHGENNFSFNALEEVDIEKQFILEQVYINNALSILYNIQTEVNNPSSIPSVKRRCINYINNEYCWVEFETRHFNQKYCPKCSEEKRKAYIDNLEIEQKEYELAAVATQKWICTFLDD